jgi:hypothetical protein
MLKAMAVAVLAATAVLSTYAADTSKPKPIDPLKWMVGSWEGQEGTGADAEIVKLKAWLAPSGNALLYHVDVVSHGKVTPRYDGMYYWLPSEKTLVIRQSAITGGVVEGEYTQNGDHAFQKERVFNPDGTTSFIEINYTISADKFRAVARFKASEKADWIPAIDVTYHRTSKDGTD